MKFRKKPVVIDAVPITDILHQAASAWNDLPQWLRAAYDAGGIVFGATYLSINTREGTMIGHRGDWLIKGVKDELYPIKDSIFRETYEPVKKSHEPNM